MTKKWTTTPAKARAAVAAMRPTPEDVADRMILEDRMPDGSAYCFVRTPSPFAQVLTTLAITDAGVTKGPTGVHRPQSLQEVGKILRFSHDDARNWSDHPYPMPTKPTPGANRPRVAYHRAYLTAARDGGYECPKENWESYGEHFGTILKGTNIVVICDEPERIVTHEPVGAISCHYKDGTIVAAISWQVIEHRFVTRPETLSVEEIAACTNEDLRSYAISKYAGPDKTAAEGWVRYLVASGAEILDKRENPIEHTMELLCRTARHNVLVVTCPTKRLFALSVPEDAKTCADAQAYLNSGRRVVART